MLPSPKHDEATRQLDVQQESLCKPSHRMHRSTAQPGSKETRDEFTQLRREERSPRQHDGHGDTNKRKKSGRVLTRRRNISSAVSFHKVLNKEVSSALSIQTSKEAVVMFFGLRAFRILIYPLPTSAKLSDLHRGHFL